MKMQDLNKSRLRSLVTSAVTAIGVMGMGAAAQAALAPAGDKITNIATVTFEDSVSNSYSVDSNSAEVVVAQIYAADIGIDQLAENAAPGSTRYTQHVITNNGNGDDVYTVNLTNRTGDSGDFSSIQGFLDGVSGAGAVITNTHCTTNPAANGTADATDAILTSTAGVSSSQIQVARGESACIIVASQVPAIATIGQTYAYTITATTANGTVVDITAGGTGGDDTTQGTNNGLVTVTNAVLNVVKSGAVTTPATATTPGVITYTVTATNNGTQDAKNVFIYDVVPPNTTFLASSVRFNNSTSAPTANDFIQSTEIVMGETAFAAAVAAVTTVDLDGDGSTNEANGEAALGLDLDGDGNTTGTPSGVFIYDDVLPVGAAISMTFQVNYASSVTAGTDIINTARYAFVGNNDGDSEEAGETGDSTTDTTSIPAYNGVDIADTGTDASVGGAPVDADNTLNEVQSITSAPEGDVVIFTTKLTNSGNIIDNLTLQVIDDGGTAWKNGPDGVVGGGDDEVAYPAALGGGNACDGTNAFPAGTTFGVYNVGGVSEVVSGLFTGVAPGATITVQIRAQLPSGAQGTNDYCASSKVTSSVGAVTADLRLEQLGGIVAAAQDVSNVTNVADAGDQNPFPAKGATIAIVAGDISQPLQVQSGTAGSTVTFDLNIHNDSAVSNTFTVNEGSSLTSTSGGTLGALPAGWSVAYTTTGGTPITSFSPITAGGTLNVKAVVTIPANALPAFAGNDIDVNGTNDPIDFNTDGNTDYPIVFAITKGGAVVDAVLNMVSVAENESITISTSTAKSVQPNSTALHPHTISNTGNTTEEVVIAFVDGNTTDFDPSKVLVDTDCDGAVDTSLISITAGTNNVCLVGDTAGNPTGDYDGTDITLAPGTQLVIAIEAKSKSSATQGDSNITAVTLTYNAGAATVPAVNDVTNVVTVQLTALKKAAIDVACDGTPDELFTTNTATATKPGECVIWQIVVNNGSLQTAKNVVVSDDIPTYTTYEAESVEVCNAAAPDTAGLLSATCTGAGVVACTGVGFAGPPAATLDDAQNNDTCSTGYDAHFDGTAKKVLFYVGEDDGSTVPNGSVGNEKGGDLLAGKAITVRFRVKLDIN